MERPSAALPASAVTSVLFGGVVGVALTSAFDAIWGPAGGGGGGGGDDAAAAATTTTDSAKAEMDPMTRVGVACAAFGNTFTLPLLFVVEVLGASFGDRVAGYIALYLIGWSPALWTVGYLYLSGASGGGGGGGAGGGGDERKGGARETIKLIAKECVNPPLVGIFLGVLIVVTPLKGFLIWKTAAAAIGGLHPIAALPSLVAKALFELATLIGAGALPGQTLVLASSFVKFKSRAQVEAEEAALLKETVGEETLSMLSKMKAMFAFGASDARALLVASAVRFFILPASMTLFALALKAANSPWYPADPVVAIVVLTMAAMPPAQNLVLLTNLQENTRYLAPRLAGLLLRMYVLAIPPVTLWLTAFAAVTGFSA